MKIQWKEHLTKRFTVSEKSGYFTQIIRDFLSGKLLSCGIFSRHPVDDDIRLCNVGRVLEMARKF